MSGSAGPTAYGTGTTPAAPSPVEQLHTLADADYEQGRGQRERASEAAVDARWRATEAANAWRSSPR